MIPNGWSSAVALLVITALDVHAQNYTAIPRWGQAAAIIYDNLFIHGGKTDPSHQYTYTSAPNSNDLLSLDLSSSFSLASPPWSYVSGSQNTSSSQGPAVAFHTLTPYTSSDLLLFGGDAGFASIGTNNNSAWLLDATNRRAPSWTSQSAGWASEPIRRIYHAAPSASGAIYILGGQKDDGSQLGFPDSYLFNAVASNGSPAFISLSDTNNAPPQLFGHAAHVLPSGLLLVFGGFSTSSNSPSPLSMIYTLDTTSSSATWSIQNASSGTTPSPRRGFASCLLDDGKILIHGGADAALQTVYSDGALLDTTQNPMTWSPVNGLSDVLGPRVGHFATPVQGQVLFGFGWAGNAPASAGLALYNPTSSAFEPSYTPPPAPISITTLPVSPTAPGGTYPSSGANTGQGGTGGDGHGSPTGTGSGSNPTSDPSQGQGGNGGANGGNGDGNGNGSGSGDQNSSKNLASIVAGSVLGFLAFVALVGGGVYYALWQRERRAWMGIDANVKKDVEGHWRLMSEDEMWDTADESPIHPAGNLQMAGTGWQGQPRRGWGLLGLGALVSGSDSNKGRKRRDMLADEDARQFDVDNVLDEETGRWSHIRTYGNTRPVMRRDGSGGSSMSFAAAAFGTGKSAWSDIVNASVTNLRNVGAALGVTATGAAAAREGKGGNVNPSEWWEKEDLPLDPVTYNAAVERGPGPTTVGMNEAMRPRGGRRTESSTMSNPYVDPFADPEDGEPDMVDPRGMQDEARASLLDNGHDEGTTSTLGAHDEGTTSTLGGPPTESSHGSLPRSAAMIALAQTATSAPMSDTSSSRTTYSSPHSTGTVPSLHTPSNDHSSGMSSPSSPRTTSIIGAIAAPNPPMRRSDSWWTRFSRTSFRDRHSFTDAAHNWQQGDPLIDFRDPNPAPRLGPIEESTQSAQSSPQTGQDSGPGTATKVGLKKEGSGYAPSTKSSIKTDHTADSELIERMGGRMEVVQRALSLSSRYTGSPSTATASPEMSGDAGRWGLSPVEASGSDDSHRRSWTGVSSGETESFMAESPVEASSRLSGETFGRPLDRAAGPSSDSGVHPHLSTSPQSSSSSASSGALPLAGPRPPRRTLTGAVAARVSAYEQRMSQDVVTHDGPRSPPADTKARRKDKEEKDAERKRRSSVGYGLVPKAPLFVANPDRRKPSGSA